MSAPSVLFVAPNDSPSGAVSEPECFRDLNLDQIVAAATKGREEYDLVPFFRSPLGDTDAIMYRQQVFADLEAPALAQAIGAFAAAMRMVRSHLARVEKLREPRQKEGRLLEAAILYADATLRLSADLATADPSSQGLRAFAEHLRAYVGSDTFQALAEGARQLKAELSAIRYDVLLLGLRVEVRAHQDAADYSDQIEATFERFSQDAACDYRFDPRASSEMSYVEGAILDRVALLNPEAFGRLAEYCEASRGFPHPAIARFDREIQFYLAYLDHLAKLKASGLPFCLPQVSASDKNVESWGGFDLALAAMLSASDEIPVVNDFDLREIERILVVSGPNQGGKTTFARTFGQLHFLAALGCPVPGTKARLFLVDRVLTHFEREESSENGRGKLEDDLLRIHAILAQATTRSLLVVNEIFASTSLRDAVFLSGEIVRAIDALDSLCVWVTFIEETASIGTKTVSYVSTVAPDDPSVRTFKVVRRDPDGLAYAVLLARSHGLSYEAVKERVRA